MKQRIAELGVDTHDIKQEFLITDYTKFDPNNPEAYRDVHKALVLGISKQKIRVRYPEGTSSKLQYLVNPTEDLKCLCALLVAGLIEPGIFADKLQEEFPEHEEAANMLRQWEQLKNR